MLLQEEFEPKMQRGNQDRQHNGQKKKDKY